MIEELILVLGVGFFSVVLIFLINFLFRVKMVYLASDISRDIQGIEDIPRPPLKNIVALVSFLRTRRKEIEEHLNEEDDEDKYRNTYG